MTPIRLLAVSAAALALSSCANKSVEDGYDTSNPYGAPQAGAGQGTANAPYQPVNPTYDTPAAYEENTSPSAPAPDTALVDPGSLKPAKPAAQVPSSPLPPAKLPAGGTVHVVVKGDTLGGIARKYGTTVAAVKQANSMTSDTVVLGKKLQIPAR